MTDIPKSLEEATEQAKVATQAAIEAGLTRLTVEMVIPELKQQPIAEQFLQVLQAMGLQFKVYFPDAGAAALAKRDWGDPDFTIRGINEHKANIEPDDEAFLLVNPSSVEVGDVEKTCEAAMDRPVVLLNPQLEDVSIVGIGYAARQLRERFLSTLEPIYYLRPMEGACVFRCYPQTWQIWKETAPNDYELVTELAQRPNTEVIENVLFGGSEEASSDKEGTAPRPKKGGLMGELQQFIRALTQ